MLEWVVEGHLARGQRPGRSCGRDVAVPRVEVDRWVAEARALGIRSVTCLLAEGQLGLYGCLGTGLVEHYRRAWFEVVHLPVEDYQDPPVPQEDLLQEWEAFQGLPKPVLVHCSAGVGRTGAAVDHILGMMGR